MRLIGFGCIQGICLLVMAGCMVGPDFHKPEPALLESWHGVNASATAPVSIAVPRETVDKQWWKGFDDPILSSLVDRAVEANLDVRIAQSRIRQARAARGVATAGLWPEIDTSANYSYNRGTLSGNGTSVGWIPGYTNNYFQAGLDASWELDFFGGVRRNVEASQADLQAAVEDRRDVLVTLLGDIGTNYINLRCFQQQIDIARSNLKSQRRTVEIVRKKHQTGVVSALDLANASAQVAQTESQIPILESSAQGAIYALSVLLAREPTALVQELITGKPIPTVPPEIPVGLPSDLLRRRPDIRRAEAAIHASTARVGVATADLFPKFSLTGSYGFSSLDIAALANWQSAAWSVGPSISWPILDAGRIRWNIEGRSAEEEQALLAYNKSVLAALKDVETSMFAYAREQERRRTLIEEVAQNQRAFDLSMKLYVTGKVDFLNVLIAERALYTSQDALAQCARSLSVDLVALYKALGGGWETLP
jgi:NodT family efflux transporter outer membrane factor (OMF) lipoprotein